jgi:cellulose 1,4-beta-cellobiosidase
MNKLLTLGGVVGLASASFTANLQVKTCDSSGCKPAQKRVALDSSSNGTEKLITVNGDALTLQYGGAAVGGPRVYLIEEEGVNKNHMFMLKGKEFTFDVEMSTMPCGFNAALYFVGMTENQGQAENGTNYCDAQAVTGTFCSEMDIMEANTEAQQFTTHGCVDACASHTDGVAQCKGTGAPSSVCDQSGCGMNPFRYGPGTTYDAEFNNADWHGPGDGYTLDSTKVFTAVTQFHTDSASGDLQSVSRFYMQKGKRIDLPTVYVLPPADGKHYGAFEKPSITEDYCVDIYDRWNGNAALHPLAQMGKNMENGMVLAMSAWYAQETYVGGKPEGTQTGMSWLDGLNNWSGMKKAGPCHESTTDAGTHHATFSNIRIGDIGTTLGSPTITV